jgi:hypothetical protein
MAYTGLEILFDLKGTGRGASLFAPSQSKLATTSTQAFPSCLLITSAISFMSYKQALKRRISFTEELDGKKADRKASPPGNVFQAASADANFDADEVEVSFLDHDSLLIPSLLHATTRDPPAAVATSYISE